MHVMNISLRITASSSCSEVFCPLLCPFSVLPNIIDTDECGDGSNGGCSHSCLNSLGSFSCNCPELHYLSVDAATCVYYGPITQRKTTPTVTYHQTTPTTNSHETTPTTEQTIPTSSFTLTTGSHQTTPITQSTPTSHPTTTPTATLSQTTPTLSQTTPTNSQTTPTMAPPTEYRCGGLLAEDVGSFQSENWPVNYPVNVECQWNVTVPNPALVLKIFFDQNPFGLAGNMPRCRKDWVKVHSMALNGTIISTLGPFCGLKTPPSIFTKTSSAMVHFHSGSKHGRSRKGFKVHYQVLEACVPIPPPLIVEGKH